MRSSVKSRSKDSDGRAIPHVNALKAACNELGRPDLYKPLTNFLLVNPVLAERNLKYALKQKRFGTAAGVMLYRSRDSEAKEYLEMAARLAKPDSAKQRRIQTFLDNFATVAKIARSSWRKSGKYEKEKREEKARMERRARLRTFRR
jgi:hypothetical protein